MTVGINASLTTLTANTTARAEDVMANFNSLNSAGVSNDGGHITTDNNGNMTVVSISNGSGLVRGIYLLTTPYLFLNNISMASGAVNTYTIIGNGTPVIPSNAAFILVSCTYAANGFAFVQMGPNGYTYSDLTNYPIFGRGQTSATNNQVGACGIVPLNTTNGKIDVQTPSGNVTNLSASVYGFLA